jgi:hypothetical protein
LLLEFCPLGGSVGVSDGGLARVALGLPRWVLLMIAATSAGVASIPARAIGSFSFAGETKW